MARATATTFARADPQWAAARTPHFLVVSNAGEQRARLVAHQFEQLRALLQSVLKARVDSARLLVALVVRNERDLRELLPPVYTREGAWLPAGVFVRGTDIDHAALRIDAGGASPYHVVYHEYLHLLTGLNFRYLPVWLDEGLAEFYATADIDEKEARFGRMLPRNVHLLRTSTPLRLETLLTVDRGSPEYSKRHRVSIFYAQSAALTHYFLVGDRGGHRAALQDYLRLVGSGATEAEAQRAAFGDLKRLEKDFGRYLRQDEFLGARVPVQLETTAIKSMPLSEAESLALRADFALHTGQQARARELVDASLLRDAALALAHRVLGSVLWAEGSRSGAVSELETAVSLGPRDFVAHYRLGVAKLPNEDDRARARREASLRRSLELHPGYVPAHAALAKLLEESGRLEEALEHARTANDAEPNDVAWSMRLLKILVALGRPSEAEVVEQDVLQRAHTDPRTLSQAARFYEEAGRLADAERLARKVRGSSERPGLLAAAGNMLARLGKHDEAESAYRAALAREPEDADTLNALGYMNADRDVRVPEALKMIEKALKQEPANAAYLDSRGWALFRLGRLEEAESVLRRALAQRENGETLDHLGEVQTARGKGTEAAASWRRALGFDDLNCEQRAAVERKLKRGGSGQSWLVPERCTGVISAGSS